MKRILYTLLGMMLSMGAWADNVAKIGETEYATLADAVSAATDGQTIMMLSNVNGASTDIPAGKRITLDLNGMVLTSESKVFVVAGDLTIEDKSVEKTGKIVSSKNAGIALNNTSNGAKVTFNSGVIEAVEGCIITGTATGATIIINDGIFTCSDNAVIAGNGSKNYKDTSTSRENPNTITITGGTFNGQIKSAGYVACGIYAPWKDVITVNGGTFNITGGCGVLARAGSVTINGGEFNCTGTATGKVGDSRVVVPCSAIVYDSEANYPAMTTESKIEVPTTSTATFKSDEGVAAVSVVGESHIEISGGTYSSPLTADVCADGYVPSNTPNADGTYGVKTGSYVAQIGTNKYETLAEAIAAANDGDEITLLGEITISEKLEISKSVTIDLNGNDIIANKMIFVNGNGKNVTIKDSKATEAPAVDAEHNVTYTSGKITTTESIFYIYNSSTLTLESGTLESTGSYPVYIDDDDAAYFVMNGGYVHGAEFAISLWASTTVNINGGVVKSDDQAAITGNGTAKWSTEKGTTVNVTGGTIIAKTKTTGDISCGIYNPQAGVVNISGGTIYADNGAGVVMRAGDLNITGGEIVTTGTGKGLVGDAKNIVPMSAVVVDVDAKYPCNTINDLGVAVTGGTLTSADGVDAISILNEEKTRATNEIVSVSGATLSGPIYTSETFSMTDNNAPYAFDNYRVKKAEYTREGVSATTWGTICLPFSITAAENGYKYYIPESVSSDELTITEITEFPITAGTPVIFKKGAGDVMISSSEAIVNKTATAGSGAGSVALVGTFENLTITENLSSIYFINGDKFHQVKASLTVPAYRAYINYSAGGAAPAVLQLVIDEESNAIKNVAAELNGTQAIYDVNGRQLSAPQKGINIMKRADGKTVKLIIK